MANKSGIDREKRMAKGCCPVHGIGMMQVGLTDIENGSQLVVVECPRRDCNIRGTMEDPLGRVTFIEESPPQEQQFVTA